MGYQEGRYYEALVRVGRLEHPIAGNVLTMARAIDEGGHTLTQLAQGMKQLEISFALATAGAAVEADLVDQLRERRVRRSS